MITIYHTAPVNVSMMTVGSLTAWTNSGKLVETGGVLNLGSTFTLNTGGTGSIIRNGGALNITGTLNNSGQTLDIGSAQFGVGGLTQLSGSIQGGTLVDTDSTPVLTSSSGALNGVTIASNLSVTGALNISNGLTLGNNVIVNANASTWKFLGAGEQDLKTLGSDTAKLTLAGTTLNAFGNFSNPGQTLTIGSGITIDGYGTLTAGSYNDAIVNNGTIQADTANALNISSVYNSNNSFTNTSSGALNVSSGSMTVGSLTAWTNSGKLVETGGVLNLGSTFTLNTGGTGSIIRNGGALNITGTLNNSGQTLDIGSAQFGVGGLTQLSGSIQGGTLVDTDSTPVLTSSSGALNGVTIASNLSVTGALNISNGLTLGNNVIVNANASTWKFLGAGEQDLKTLGSDTAKLTLAGTTLNAFGNFSNPGQTLTIGSGITIDGYGTLTAGSYNDAIVNNGSILADVANQILNISSVYQNNNSFINNGSAIQTTGSLNISNLNSFTNPGTLLVNNINVSNLTPNTGTIELGLGGLIQTNNSNFTNAAGGIIKGSGTINLGSSTYTFTNNGTLSPTTPANGLIPLATGYLNIIGNLLLGSTSITNINLDGLFKGTTTVNNQPVSGYDAIHASGNITINSGAVMNVSQFGSFSAATGDVFQVLEAGSTLNGIISTLNLPGNFNSLYDSSGKNLILRDNTTSPVLIWQTDASGNWTTAANWNLNRAPQAGDIVLIDRPNATPTITINSGSQVADRILSSENLTISSGSLNLNGTTMSWIDAGGNLTLSGGTLGGTDALTVTGAFTVTGNNNSTLSDSGSFTTQGTSTINLSAVNGFLSLTNGKTWNNQGALTVGGDDYIIFGYGNGGTNTLNNLASGTVNLSSPMRPR